MIKVLVCGDNHYNSDVIKRLLIKHNDCDFYLHTGDSELYADQLKPFISVRGNNDYDINNMPRDRIISINDYFQIYLTHGTFDYNEGYKYLSDEGLSNGCNIVIFGHLHRYIDEVVNNIHIINPGSCRSNRDGSRPTYAILYIDKDKIKVEKHTIDDLNC